MALLARAMDFTLTVRSAAGNREWITRILDAGVWSLHVPQVDTPEIAHEGSTPACTRRMDCGGWPGLAITPTMRRALWGDPALPQCSDPSGDDV